MPLYTISFSAMASACDVVLHANTPIEAQQHATVAIEEVRRIEAKYSRYLPHSVVSTINALAGEHPVHCDDETWALLDYADTLYQHSNGLFDITSGILRRAWNFHTPTLPCPEDIAQLLPRVGWSQVLRSDHAIYLPARGMEIDFGGFGKEYAADRAAALLSAQGVTNGYVNLGGDMHFIGPKPDLSPWQIGLQDPRQRDGVMASVPLSSGALATSGDYERFIVVNGQRYCHVLNPKTGSPVSYWRSVSVCAPLTTLAGSCSTTAMLLESEGHAFLESTGWAYHAVDHSGRVYTRSG